MKYILLHQEKKERDREIKVAIVTFIIIIPAIIVTILSVPIMNLIFFDSKIDFYESKTFSKDVITDNGNRIYYEIDSKLMLGELTSKQNIKLSLKSLIIIVNNTRFETVNESGSLFTRICIGTSYYESKNQCFKDILLNRTAKGALGISFEDYSIEEKKIYFDTIGEKNIIINISYLYPNATNHTLLIEHPLNIDTLTVIPYNYQMYFQALAGDMAKFVLFIGLLSFFISLINLGRSLNEFTKK